MKRLRKKDSSSYIIPQIVKSLPKGVLGGFYPSFQLGSCPADPAEANCMLISGIRLSSTLPSKRLRKEVSTTERVAKTDQICGSITYNRHNLRKPQICVLWPS